MVLNVDKKNQRFALGIKQIQTNPWDDIQHRYRMGQVIKGRVTNATKFGAFVEIEPGIEGLVHISELSHQRVEKVEEVIQEGQEIEAVVINVEPKEHKIGLSYRNIERYESHPYRNEVLANDDDTSEFGRMLKENLERRMRRAGKFRDR